MFLSLPVTFDLHRVLCFIFGIHIAWIKHFQRTSVTTLRPWPLSCDLGWTWWGQCFITTFSFHLVVIKVEKTWTAVLFSCLQFYRDDCASMPLKFFMICLHIKKTLIWKCSKKLHSYWRTWTSILFLLIFIGCIMLFCLDKRILILLIFVFCNCLPIIWFIMICKSWNVEFSMTVFLCERYISRSVRI